MAFDFALEIIFRRDKTRISWRFSKSSPNMKRLLWKNFEMRKCFWLFWASEQRVGRQKANGVLNPGGNQLRLITRKGISLSPFWFVCCRLQTAAVAGLRNLENQRRKARSKRSHPVAVPFISIYSEHRFHSFSLLCPLSVNVVDSLSADVHLCP